MQQLIGKMYAKVLMNGTVESTEMETGEERCSLRKDRSFSDGNLFIKQMCEQMK